MKIMVMDGQGGRMGKSVVEQIRARFPEDEILAIGTNSIATAAMLKAGADAGAERSQKSADSGKPLPAFRGGLRGSSSGGICEAGGGGSEKDKGGGVLEGFNPAR